MESLLFQFLWKGNVNFRRSVAINSYELARLKRLYSDKENTPDFYLKDVGEEVNF